MGELLSLIGFVVVAVGVVVLFRRLPEFHLTTRGHALALIVGGLLVMGVGTRITGASAQTAASSAVQTSTPSASATPTPKPTPKPTSTPTPKPTPTPTPTKTPSPSTDPHALTAANVKQSIIANEKFGSSTVWDGLAVDIRQGGQIVVVTKPQSTIDEQYFITQCADDSLAVVQAVKGWYSGVTVIHMQCDADFTDQYGQTTNEPGTWLEFTSSTFNKFNPSGMTVNTFAQPAGLYAIADAYYIHPAVWKNIKPANRGRLFNFESGTPLVNPIPQ